MNKKLPVSVVISAFNEEKKIAECLESVKWAEEVIVVNNESTDKTEEIAKKYGAKVFDRKNNLMLNVNKNFGFTKATQPWILSLDADERVTEELAEEIKSLLSIQEEVDSSERTSPPPSPKRRGSNKDAGFWIPRKNIIFGKWIQNSIWWPDYQLRLFRKGKGEFPEKHVHEMISVEGETVRLQYPMIHFNYESVSQFLYKMDKIYTENEMTNILNSGKQLTWVDALRFPSEDFLRTFFLRKGYKDGLHGLVLSLLQAFYAEIIFVKVWEKQGFKEFNSSAFLKDISKEMKKVALEFQYWIISSLVDESKNKIKKAFLRFKRKSVTRKLR